MSESNVIDEIQNRIVYLILETLPQSFQSEPAASWERIVVNVENELDETSVLNGAFKAFAVANIEGRFERHNLLPDVSVRDEFAKLRKAIQEKEGSLWGTCHLIVNADGTYQFSYDYKPAIGINDEAVNDAEYIDYFKNYHVHYAEERRRRDAGEAVDSLINPVFRRE